MTITTSLQECREYNPHHFLGLHDGVIRLWRPGAERVQLEVLGQIVEASSLGAGLFEYRSPQKITPKDYRVYHNNGLLAHDPYSFAPLLGEMDAYLFNVGCHYELYRILGAHLRSIHGISGVLFALWAPNARQVSLVGDFNHWDGRSLPMRSMGASGIWELFVPGLEEGVKYKFELWTKSGERKIKSDPFAFGAELRPSEASVVRSVETYEWQDKAWMEGRKKLSLDRPINIYEIHLGSWKQFEGEFPNARFIAGPLADYCKQMGFTHVELLPVMEHPLDESWGYQVTGFFAFTSRFGTPSDFQYFVDHLHAQGIGVLLDWVPAHFPMDEFSLHRFDGTALYEHEDPRRGIHPHWNTAIFNYGRKEVSNFLMASALFWFDQMHIDGLRVDAVASMLYLDYGRKAGEWIPNADGSQYDEHAIEFIKHLNSIVHQKFPGVLMIAEESTSYAKVSHPVEEGGLGFDFKWNMGWMNDTLRYFTKDPIYRSHHQNDLTFSLLYIFSERFVSVLSHDEVVHMKGSLLSKMPGPDWQKFANVRLLYSYMMTHPGKKLLFMGGEMGQWTEWDCKGSLDWALLGYPLHVGLHRCVQELNHFYLQKRALWRYDFDWQGYEGIDLNDANASVISYLRKAESEFLVVVHHFTPEYRENYWVRLGNIKEIKEVFNTDDVSYGGSGKRNQDMQIHPDGFSIHLAPLATMIFEVKFA
jgi:1,4-alpha-glucan branching enzyme